MILAFYPTADIDLYVRGSHGCRCIVYVPCGVVSIRLLRFKFRSGKLKYVASLFSNFSSMFQNLNNVSNLNLNFSNLLDMRKLQELLKKALQAF